MSVSEFDVSFKSFGRAFQERVLQALLSDVSWSQQMMEVVRAEYFEPQYLRRLFEIYARHYSTYKTFPSLTMLAVMVRDELKEGDKDELLCSQIVSFLENAKGNPNLNDIPYVKDRALNFCKNQALKEALERAVDLTREQRYEEIVGHIKEAITVGTPNTTGHDFFEEPDVRFARDDRSTVATGLLPLDHRDVMNGGLGAGELGCIMSATGGGKCVSADTNIRIRYDQVVIDGYAYDPWEKLLTKRGHVFARDVRSDDELA